MRKGNWSDMIFNRQNLVRLILLVFGFTLFPAVVYWGEKLLSTSSQTLSEFYAKLYGALMDWGMDGMLAWCVVCTPYLAYDIYLIIQDLRRKRMAADKR